LIDAHSKEKVATLAAGQPQTPKVPVIHGFLPLGGWLWTTPAFLQRYRFPPVIATLETLTSGRIEIQQGMCEIGAAVVVHVHLNEDRLCPLVVS
jgi:hypothetical protein